jgi:ubiquinone/menaquinone biosynthesis C-methylase UbiE
MFGRPKSKLKLGLKYLLRVTNSARTLFSNALYGAADSITIKKTASIPIRQVSVGERTGRTPVEAYWGEHTVGFLPVAAGSEFKNTHESKRHIAWRFKAYPLFGRFMQLYGDYHDKVILDYGCGPGSDLVGFLLYSNPRKVVGIDVSLKALEMAERRLELHGVNADRIELINIPESLCRIPLLSDSVDLLHCCGVLQHASNPVAMLREFFRVLKPGSHANIMAYNRDSVWTHLYVAYVLQILEGRFSAMSVNEAFSRSTDGPGCPISACYEPGEFASMCETAGFAVQYLGGYFSVLELDLLRRHANSAMKDSRLHDEHRKFISSLVRDESGYPLYRGKHAGVGGVYRLRKPDGTQRIQTKTPTAWNHARKTAVAKYWSKQRRRE